MSTLVATRSPQGGTADAPRSRDQSLCLGTYLDLTGRGHQIISITRSDKSVLVLDTGSGGLRGARVVARLAGDEPPENAQLVCEMYLADETRGRCRVLTSEDLDGKHRVSDATRGEAAVADAPVVDTDGRRYCICCVGWSCSIPELRWTCSPALGGAGPCELLTLRDVVAAIEDYEPAKSMTCAALAAASSQREVSTHRLDGELRRLTSSGLVLNRKLREAVERTIARDEISLSEIALRCGRLKQRGSGHGVGDTSWLERRIGRRAESGETVPHRWVHTDVLAVIARDGLGVNPNEVEV